MKNMKKLIFFICFIFLVGWCQAHTLTLINNSGATVTVNVFTTGTSGVNYYSRDVSDGDQTVYGADEASVSGEVKITVSGSSIGPEGTGSVELKTTIVTNTTFKFNGTNFVKVDQSQ